LSGSSPSSPSAEPTCFEVVDETLAEALRNIPPERSLGDILGEALRADAEPVSVPTAEPLWCQQMTAAYLAKTIGPMGEYSGHDVLQVFLWMPMAYVAKLNSPEGWTELADYAAGRLCACPPNFRPTIH
jgi:hypothetical protein